MYDTRTYRIKYCNTIHTIVASSVYHARTKFCEKYDICGDRTVKVLRNKKKKK